MMQLFVKFIELLNDFKDELAKEAIPICFHCGKPYILDEHYSETWMPNCNCINKPTIRINIGFKND